jgi:hypothetical protein
VLATAARQEARHGLSAKDAIVYASVLSHLDAQAGAPSCFLTRDADFDDPDIVHELKEHGCRLIPRFDAGLSCLGASLGSG